MLDTGVRQLKHASIEHCVLVHRNEHHAGEPDILVNSINIVGHSNYRSIMAAVRQASHPQWNILVIEPESPRHLVGLGEHHAVGLVDTLPKPFYDATAAA